MTATANQVIRLCLLQWAKWKNGQVKYETAYRSPPNMIYKLMTGDFGVGGGVAGSRAPYAAFKGSLNSGFVVDVDCLRLDDIINRLPGRRKETIYQEFLGRFSGDDKSQSDVAATQKQKAARMSLSLDGYKSNLKLSLKQIINEFDVKNCVNNA